MELKSDDGGAEKHVDATPGYESNHDPNHDPESIVVTTNENPLHQDLKGRHMQMIAMQDHLSQSPSPVC
jgi:amino acid transporter